MMSATATGTGNLQPVNVLFLGLPDSHFAAYMSETDEFIARHPEILDSIKEDLERHAKKKKKDRIEDREWEKAHSSIGLPGMKPEVEEVDPEEIELQQGRPRIMDAYVTFMFMMARGYEGGESQRSVQDLVSESKTMYVLVKNKNITLPAESTINENLNAVSNESRKLIHRRHLEQVKAGGLDDFKEMTTDSTAVEANTAWPTDSMIIMRLIDRIWRTGNKLEQFGTEDFQRWWTETWLAKMRSLCYGIVMADTSRERKKLYRDLYEKAQKAHRHLSREYEVFMDRVEPESLKPSLRRRLGRIQRHLNRDLENAHNVICYSKKRVLEGQTTSSSQKVLSLGAPDAAFIKKGDRDPVIGYRPQVARSKNGFIGHLKVPEGNANDAPQLHPSVLGWIHNTGVIPDIVSADDGYASTDGVKDVKDLGVEKVSISGSKGKQVLSEEEWNDQRIAQARRERSKVESSMFTLKFGYDFDRSSRTGLQAVRGEALEKVIAHNFFRAVQLKRRRKKCHTKRAA